MRRDPGNDHAWYGTGCHACGGIHRDGEACSEDKPPARGRMQRLRHRLAHLLGTATGKVETWWEPGPYTGRLMVGFRCDDCGELRGVDEVPKHIAGV